ncbi:hypothetical protein HZA45_00140 [Candidatus Peregrinibacteria bacterium]|nr:hypothetical protein [Candidatus Peregrinibacteria bacterium]
MSSEFENALGGSATIGELIRIAESYNDYIHNALQKMNETLGVPHPLRAQMQTVEYMRNDFVEFSHKILLSVGSFDASKADYIPSACLPLIVPLNARLTLLASIGRAYRELLLLYSQFVPDE